MKQNRLFIIISIIFFLLYIFIISMTYIENKGYLLKNTKDDQIKLVHAYKAKFDEKLSALKHIVETMGKKLIKKDRFKDFYSIKETLTTAMNSGTGFTSVYIAYPDNFTISGRPNWFYSDDYIATQRPWYKAAIKEGQTTISKPYYGSPGFENTIYISIVSPVYDVNGKLLAVMASDLEFESVQKELSLLFPIENSFSFLMTNEAEVIAQSNKLGIDFSDKKLKTFLSSFSNEKMGDKIVKIKNKEYIVTYETLKNSDWLFVSLLDKNEIYKNLDTQLFMNLLASLVLFILGLGTIIFLSLTQKKLQEKHLLLGHFAKSPTWGILLTDKNGNIIFINRVFERIFNLKSKSLYGAQIDSIIHKLKPKQKEIISSFEDIKTNPFSIKSYSIEKNEKTYRVQITPLLEHQKELEGAIITINDISHEKYLERKESEHEQILIQNSKMAALGEMVSAISHQWRQPLSTLLMLISNTEELTDSLKAKGYLNRSRDTIELMNETINAFRNFYKEDFGKGKFDLIDTIKEIILISSPQMKMNGIELEFNYDENSTFKCENYPSYIKQVLINLIGNAKDELSSILKNNPLYEASIKITLYKKEEFYYISVEDNGEGIDEKYQDKIFEPFFTTKGEQGTGTGLYLCKLLVENKMQGKFILDSSKQPTRFIIKIGTKNV